MKVPVENIYGFDTEGDNGELGFICVSFVNETVKVLINDSKKAIDWMDSLDPGNYIFVATNIDYDLSMLFHQNLHLLEFFYARDRLIYATYRNGNVKIDFYDTVVAIGIYSVENLGKMIGIYKLPTPRWLIERITTQETWSCLLHKRADCMVCYNIQDSYISYKAFMLFYYEFLEIGVDMQKTIAGSGVKLWLKDKDKRIETSLPTRYDFLARKGYYGGRTEVFTVGKVDEVNAYDVNSLYPYIMEHCLFPDVDELYVLDSPKSYNVVRKDLGVADVTIEMPKLHIPPLPYRTKGKLIFPYGTFRGSWTTPLINLAIKHGARVIQCHSFIGSASTVRPFKGFIRRMYERRMEAKAEGNPNENVFKILMNAVYGKLAQGTSEDIGWLKAFTPESYTPKTAILPRQEIDNTVFFIEPIVQFKREPHQNVLWAAMITAYAQELLYEYMEELDFDVDYCDTDSIWTKKKLPTSNELGAMKLEKKCLTATFLAPKFYSYTTYDGEIHYVAKGAPANLQADYFNGKEITMRIPVKLLSASRLQLPPAAWYEITRQHGHDFDKRSLTDPLVKWFSGNSSTSPVDVTMPDL